MSILQSGRLAAQRRIADRAVWMDRRTRASEFMKRASVGWVCVTDVLRGRSSE